MAETGKSGKTPRGALVEGAERFDRLARAVKDNQLGRTKTGSKPPVSETFTLSPEDSWAKKYMTQCIGPVCFDLTSDPPVFAKFTAPPVAATAQTQGLRAAGPREPSAMPPGDLTSGRVSAVPIGTAIGKPPRARTWLGRLFGR